MIDLAVISAIVARDRVAGHFAGPAATPRNSRAAPSCRRSATAADRPPRAGIVRGRQGSRRVPAGAGADTGGVHSTAPEKPPMTPVSSPSPPHADDP